MSSRREFVTALGAAALGSSLPLGREREMPNESAEAGAIRFGYAAITWGGDDRRAIEDIAAAGFDGVQLRGSAARTFGGEPGALRALLERHGLTFVALSSGNLRADPPDERAAVDEHVEHARFLRDAGGLYLQIIDQRPAGRPVEDADYERLGRLMTAIGERTAALGVPVAYHPHMGTVGETPEAADRVLQAADPRYVKLLLDVAHYAQGGGDPAAAIRRYRDRLLLLHLKDVAPVTPDTAGGAPYRFVELGRGRVDLRAVFAALREIGFRGWAVVELDSVPDGARTPKDSALMSRRYLEETLGVWRGK